MTLAFRLVLFSSPVDARDRIATGSSKEDVIRIDSSSDDEQSVAFPLYQSRKKGGDATVQKRNLLATFGGDNDDQGDEDGFQISALKRANHSLNVDLQHTHMRENSVWHSPLPSTSYLQWRPRPRPRRVIHRNDGMGIFGRLNATDDESTNAGLHRVKEREQNAIAETFYPKESYANQQVRGEDVSMVDIANIAPSISLLIRTLRERCPNAAESNFSSSSSGWCTSDDDDSESEATSHSALLSKQANFLPLKRTSFHK